MGEDTRWCTMGNYCGVAEMILLRSFEWARTGGGSVVRTVLRPSTSSVVPTTRIGICLSLLTLPLLSESVDRVHGIIALLALREPT